MQLWGWFLHLLSCSVCFLPSSFPTSLHLVFPLPPLLSGPSSHLAIRPRYLLALPSPSEDRAFWCVLTWKLKRTYFTVSHTYLFTEQNKKLQNRRKTETFFVPSICCNFRSTLPFTYVTESDDKRLGERHGDMHWRRALSGLLNGFRS